MGATSREAVGGPIVRRSEHTEGLLRHCGILFCFVAIAAGLQVAAGAYRVELASDPDEPAHAVSGIAVQQYVRHGLFQSPRRFLAGYYQHYPKVAIGHWPPLLYVAEAAILLAVPAPRMALLLLQALFAGLTAWLVFRESRAIVSPPAAFLGSVALLCGKTFQSYTAKSMTEIPLSLLMLLACLAFARFAESQQPLHALAFGLCVTGAILTKGTGWALLGVPAIVVVSTRSWHLLRRPAIWAALGIVGVLCIPWQLATFSLVSAGWQGAFGLAYSREAAAAFTKWMLTVPGISVSASGAIGFYATAIRRQKFGRTRFFWMSVSGLVCVAWAMHVLTPASITPRHLTIAIAPMFLLSAAGAAQLAIWIFPQTRWRPAADCFFACIAAISLALSLPVAHKPPQGFIPVAETLTAIMPAQSACLVVSNAQGEGALVSEMAFRAPNPTVYVLRGLKLLASERWSGQDFELRVHSTGQCARLLESVPVSFLVVDRRNWIYRDHRLPNLIESMLREHSSEWTQVNYLPSRGTPEIALYRLGAGPLPVRKLPTWIAPSIRGGGRIRISIRARDQVVSPRGPLPEVMSRCPATRLDNGIPGRNSFPPERSRTAGRRSRPLPPPHLPD